MECHEYTVYGSYDTSGRPVSGWKCYCGTTACLKQRGIQNIAEVEIISQKPIGELTLEEESRFYKKVFGR